MFTVAACVCDATMFRPIPEAPLFRRIPYRLIASVLLILALVVSVTLLFSLERKNFSSRGSRRARRCPRNCSRLSGSPAAT